MQLTHKLTDYVSYYDLSDDVNYVRLKTVLQTHFVFEKNVKENCEGSCKDIHRLALHSDRNCKGHIYYCNKVLGKSSTAYKLRSVSFNNKILFFMNLIILE